ncbi:S-adenosyl-L-methionine-dependent methyltransferase [Halteromyces radiatus]|uniref:S-adenosyl-L-methionine-dependent methyltransferase n=1 Tax=Halteromyces radiatus TaxID=101107 RepID=UPI00221F316F|nr:S-adenosyl-L-methionine-dependent methyltransferase [Halteromyces radiatus]KAI8096471.1 S-adenosyl-L-methionine-dependent methyltransferase [Halteromyces radiatus]
MNPSVEKYGRTYHAITSSTYTLPRDAEERKRLSLQHTVLKDVFKGNILPIITSSLPKDAKILDIGCGSCDWCVEVANSYSDAQVQGVDMSDLFPKDGPKNAKFDVYNVLNGLPYEDNTFDLVQMRLLILAWRTEEWHFMLKEIHRVLKPGGYVQLIESRFTTIVDNPTVELLNNTMRTMMKERGLESCIVEKLNNWIPDHGFQLEERQKQDLDFSDRDDSVAQTMVYCWIDVMKAMKPYMENYLIEHDIDQLLDQYSQECGLTNFFQFYAFVGKKL